jgi:hypothetical protein
MKWMSVCEFVFRPKRNQSREEINEHVLFNICYTKGKKKQKRKKLS